MGDFGTGVSRRPSIAIQVRCYNIICVHTYLICVHTLRLALHLTRTPTEHPHANTHAWLIMQRGRSRRNLEGRLEEEEETIWSTTIIPKIVYKLRATKRHVASNSPSKPQGIARDTLQGKLRRFKQGSVRKEKDVLRKGVKITDKTTVKRNTRRRTGKVNRRRFAAATTIASLWYVTHRPYAKVKIIRYMY
jgi:hypothetical protein